jgi:hypothetical protein
MVKASLEKIDGALRLLLRNLRALPEEAFGPIKLSGRVPETGDDAELFMFHPMSIWRGSIRL